MPGFGNIEVLAQVQGQEVAIHHGRLGMKAEAAPIWADEEAEKGRCQHSWLSPLPPFHSVWDPGLRDNVAHIQDWIYPFV